jgi:saccharopine dehydrogenase (NAD+, L-lysine-forming)
MSEKSILQLLDGSARKPGLHFQAHLVEPQRLIRDMARLGIEVKGETLWQFN